MVVRRDLENRTLSIDNRIRVHHFAFLIFGYARFLHFIPFIRVSVAFYSNSIFCPLFYSGSFLRHPCALLIRHKLVSLTSHSLETSFLHWKSLTPVRLFQSSPESMNIVSGRDFNAEGKRFACDARALISIVFYSISISIGRLNALRKCIFRCKRSVRS